MSSSSLDPESTCDHESAANVTFAYSVIYFFSASFLLFCLEISPLGNQPTENIGVSCHKYWKLYEEEDEEDDKEAEATARLKGERGKMIKRARKRLRKGCCKNCRKLSKLVKPGECIAFFNNVFCLHC
jgi:hypothetical protein